MKIKIGTRASRLAMWQAYYIQKCLEDAGAETEIVAIETKGDKVLNVALSKIGSKGVFTEELEEMLLNGEIDIAVHSAKDLQSDLGVDFEIVAFTEREKPNDVLISDSLINLSQPITVGSSSVRRLAFFKRYYPHVNLVNIRGNLQTRIAKMREGQCDALMLAFAGVNRMEYNNLIVHEFSIEQFIPPVGQGTVAVQAATNLDKSVKEFVRNACNNIETEECLLAERSFLATMNGGCSIPVFGYAKRMEQKIELKAGIVALDGSEKIIIEAMQLAAESAADLGQRVGLEVLNSGGKEILDYIKFSQ